MIVARTLEELTHSLSKNERRVGFVPTMGALHEGHLSLISMAQANADLVVVSIFVNPLQFSAGEDFDKYPRVLESDIEKLETAGVDVLFAPGVPDIYPNGQEVSEQAGELGSKFEGQMRPGHFDGMLTVVNKLFEIIQPDVVVFGQKDAQQVELVKRLIAKKTYGGKNVELIVGPTLREASGLAMSSRNRYLSASEKIVAESISQALFSADHSNSAQAAIAAARATINPEARLEYLELVDEHFEPVGPDFQGDALMIVACKVGSTRLIDNHRIHIEREA